MKQLGYHKKNPKQQKIMYDTKFILMIKIIIAHTTNFFFIFMAVALN